MELLTARNPDPDSRLPYLLLLPLAGGMVFRTSGTWPRTSAVYCYPVPAEEWPGDPEIVERAGLRSCVRRGAAIDLVLDRTGGGRIVRKSCSPGPAAGTRCFGSHRAPVGRPART